jgi:hypothetical protein
MKLARLRLRIMLRIYAARHAFSRMRGSLARAMRSRREHREQASNLRALRQLQKKQSARWSATNWTTRW